MGAQDRKGTPSGHAVGKKSHHHWASKCKVDFTMEFEQRCIPLEPTTEEERKEMHKLECFFHMTESEMKHSVSNAIANAARAFVEAGRLARTSSEGVPEEEDKAPRAAKLAAGQWRMMTEVPLSPPGSAHGREGKRSPRLSAKSDLAQALSQPPAAASKGPQKPVGITGSALSEPVPAGSIGAPLPVPLPVMVAGRAVVGDRAKVRDWLGMSLSELEDAFDSRSHDRARPWKAAGSDSEKDEERKKVTQVQQHIHRPISPWELRETSIPAPLSVLPLCQRPPSRRQESHYDYFNRKIPGENPYQRKAQQGKTDTTRKIYHMQVAGNLNASSSWGELARGGTKCLASTI